MDDFICNGNGTHIVISYSSQPCPLCACYKEIAELEKQTAVDGPIYNAGRREGHADMCAALRAILDPQDKEHWDENGILKEISKLKEKIVQKDFEIQELKEYLTEYTGRYWD